VTSRDPWCLCGLTDIHWLSATHILYAKKFVIDEKSQTWRRCVSSELRCLSKSVQSELIIQKWTNYCQSLCPNISACVTYSVKFSAFFVEDALNFATCFDILWHFRRGAHEQPRCSELC